ncbi:AGAP003461-PA [Anopheles gambiae str. PEST]|uniref:UDP-N-acetylglucosamine transferase subunit ALG14 n=2 Tax=gambiae species complex TaxID=44542 RepID=Q7QDG2_ANOGA|nr:UDP-N-acetylglucosamine transferase subunit ALG14 homolog [Anopheles coluzzii]XP_311747.5 UDP-N-acetylglucosamine transferase subunit ALG14 homolog [Anopheles gambiae]EAA07383.5 AGAP003461-PA [Anopheles gambiae str. PEST]
MAFLASLLLFLGGLLLVRLVQLLVSVRRGQSGTGVPPRTTPARTMIVMGSGGHTAEMLRIVERLDGERYSPRQYVIASTDKTSVVKVIESEVRRQPDTQKQTYEIVTIPRSRAVHQSYLSSVATTVLSLLSCVPIVLKARPELILTNGPGTCVPVCLVAFLARLLFLNTKCRIVFVESFCRVRSLSLSGRILLYIVDMFVVQWPELLERTATTRQDVRCFGRL